MTPPAGSPRELIRAAWPFRETPPRRVVIKVGSNVLALKEGGLNLDRISELAAIIASARKQGTEVILVTSGAVAAGRGLLKMPRRPTVLSQLQAVAAIGQCALMEAYARAFRTHGLIAAQLLLNRDDMDDRRRYLNARNALISLLEQNAIPVVNENDTVNVEELKFGDNDMLSAMVTAKMDADLLVILTNVPGLMTGHPMNDPNAALIPVVTTINRDVENLVSDGNSEFGTGGMATKLMAARHATQFGAACVVADGTVKNQVAEILLGDFEGTYFCPKGTRKAGSSRRHWIYARRPRGEVVVDKGAEKALVSGGKSLLPVGIVGVGGTFQKGDIVRLVNEAGEDLARGITNYPSEVIDLMKGKKSGDLTDGELVLDYPEVVHRDNLVLA